MKYIGLQSQIWRNNTRSVLLLILFPLVIIALAFVGSVIYVFIEAEAELNPSQLFIRIIPVVIFGVGIWFLTAYNLHSSMINKATGSVPLQRKVNKRVYNLVENLCITTGMSTPKINIIDDDSLNAFASGLNEKSYSISLSKGIIEKLDNDELEGVIAHELTHIRNRDVRLLVVSIIFVGIFAFLTHALLRSMRFRGGGNNKNGAAVIIVLLLSAIGWLLTTIFRFALSRKREYLADAGAAELTRKPKALASALRKVSQDSRIEAVTRKDVAQLFIDNPGEKKKKSVSFSSMFATHPPIDDRIAVLEQY